MSGAIYHPVRVLVAHSEPLLSLGLVSALRAKGLDAHIVDIVENPLAFWDGSFTVALLDYGTVFKLLGAQERRKGPCLPKVMVLAASHGVAWVRAGAEVGVTGFLTSGCDEEELIDAVLALERGQRYVCGPAAEQLAESMFRSQLTPRQTEVLGLIAQGLSNKVIAGQLGLSVATVKTHVKEVLHRLQFDNRSKAVSYAIRQGLAPKSSGSEDGWAEEMSAETSAVHWPAPKAHRDCDESRPRGRGSKAAHVRLVHADASQTIDSVGA